MYLSIAYLRRNALALLALSAAGTAQAHVFCVTTSAELQQALTDTSTNGMYNGEDNAIDLAQGVYKTGAATANGPFHFGSTAAHSISINGGYGPNCIGYTFDATSAVLDGNNTTQVLAMLNQNAGVGLSRLTIRNGEATSNGGGVAIGTGGYSYVQLSIIKNNHTTTQGGGFALYGIGANTADYMYVGTNLISGNSANQDAGAGIVSATAATISVTRNTVYGNTTSAPGMSTTGTGGLMINSAPSLIINNIFKQNTLNGAYLGASGIVFSYNDYGAIGGSPFDPGSAGNTTVAAGFVDAVGGNFHLAGSSPLLGFTPSVVGTTIDLEDHSYPATGKGDLGAYAETIFTDGFDGN